MRYLRILCSFVALAAATLLFAEARATLTIVATSSLTSPLPTAGGEFGDDIALGDINGDGIDDLIAGAPREASYGRVHVRWGGAFTSGISALNPGAGPLFAEAIAVGDIDNDGYDDIVAGSKYADVGSFLGAGEAWVLFGPDLTRKHALYDPQLQAAAAFGVSVASGDVNDDGFDDVVVGAWDSNIPPYFKSGQAFVYFGPSLSSAVTLQSPNPQQVADFGVATAMADYDGDGTGDVIVGSWLADVAGATESGAVFVFGGPSLSLIATLSDPFPMPRRTGMSLAAGDIDGDPSAEIVAGASGRALLFAHTGPGTYAAQRFELPPVWSSIVTSVAVGDANGDGTVDVAIGAGDADIAGAANAGGAILYVSARFGSPYFLQPQAIVAGDAFGQSLALAPNVALVSAPEAGSGRIDLVPLTDTDSDTWLDLDDNCPAAANSTQANADGNLIDLPGKPYDDVTLANSDTAGDACDPDADNDGLSNLDEASGAACGGTTTNSLLRDSDGDHAIDGAECALGTNPTNVANEPSAAACGGNTDADGDKVLSFREVCYYGTNPGLANSDGDTRNDGCEVYSINGDLVVNVIDLQQIASASGGYASPGTPVQVDFDVTKNGAIDVIDLQQTAAAIAVCV